MARMIDDTLKAQLSKKLVWFCKYFPVRITNGFPHIRISGDRLAVHEHRHDKEKSITKTQVIELDAEYFAHREVAVFDDIITTGSSYAIFANQLESFGANVLGAIFGGEKRNDFRRDR